MPIDTINDLTPRIQYIATAAQTEFDYPFPIFTDADLVVDVDGVTQALDTDYTVTGEGDDTGGTVTLLSAMAGDEVVTIYRDMAIERTTDFSANGALSSEAFNDEFDRITLVQQDLAQKLRRCLRIPLTGNATDAETELSPTATWAGKYLRFDDDGVPEPAATVDSTTLTQSLIATTLYPQTTVESSAGVTPVNYAVDTTSYHKLERYYNGTIADGANITSALANALLINKGVQLPGFEMLCDEVAVPAACWIKGVHRKTVLKPVNSGTTRMLNITGTGYPTGAKSFVKISDLMLYNGGVTANCIPIYARFFDELFLQDIIVDNFKQNLSIQNGAFVYGRNVRSWSATEYCLYLKCDQDALHTGEVGFWSSFIDSEFCGGTGSYNAYVEDWADVKFIKCEFDSGTTGLLIKQAYTATPENAASVVVSHCGIDSCTAVGLKLDTIRAFTIAHNWVSAGRSGIGYDGINISGCRQGSIVDNDIANCGNSGLQITSSSEIEVRGNRAYANGQTGALNRGGIRLSGSSRCTVANNKTVNESYGFGVESQQYGIIEDVGSDNNIFTGNISADNDVAQYSLSGASSIVRDNIGYVSENKGTASVLTGTTSIAVTHGLSFTPALTQISVTPTTTLGSATEFWISNPTSTQFTINVDVNPAGTASFVWRASRN
jgi:parallel beta-helix repeat protein